MERETRIVAAATTVMFAAMFTSASYIQVIQADELAASSFNTRTVLRDLDKPRGRLLVGGRPIAESVPSGDSYGYLRTYPEGATYAPVTGYSTVLPSSTGLERALGTELAGSGSALQFRRLQRIFSGAPDATSDIALTLHPGVQQAAYDALTIRGLTGSVVALEPSTGRVLALVSTPSFDPNELAGHDPEQVQSAYSQLESSPAGPLHNRAIAGSLNPPGSVFKLVTVAAALESGAFGPDSLFDNPARIPLPGTDQFVRNTTGRSCGPGDAVTLQRAVADSCNIPFVQIGAALGESALVSMANGFGFAQPLDIPLSVTPSTLRSGMSEAQLALSAFGQDDVRVTPMQIAMVAATVANGGTLMKPTLVDSIINPHDGTSQSFAPEALAQPISAATSEVMTRMMQLGVESGAAANAAIAGVDVAGKTGTAENGEDDPFTLWFTGFAPAQSPRIAVAVVIEDGGGLGQRGSGSEIAAPIAAEVLASLPQG